MSPSSNPQQAVDQPSPSAPSVSIRQATTPADIAAISECFRAYTEWLGLDLSFQNYGSEAQNLPGKYAPPTGALLLARDSETGEVLGCVALRPLELQPNYKASRPDNRRYCEVKRLFVYPAARGRRVAKALIGEVMKVVKREAYDEVLLDTLGSMKPAIMLYKSEGFSEVEPYYFNPLDDVVYMSKKIEAQSR